MCRSRLWLLYWVSTAIRNIPALTRLDSAKSTSRYMPPNGTAGLARSAVSGASRLPSPPASTIAKTSVISTTERRVDDTLGLLEDLLEVLRALEALGIELVHVLGARRPGREPAAVGHDLDPAERRARRRRGEDLGDRLTGKLGRGQALWREAPEHPLLLGGRRGVDAAVHRRAIAIGQLGVHPGRVPAGA